ncbi:uncharacterized protein N7477_002238 [Penicillium maclennaniae]|uniref:uncharacterized protein n=1 Tax=Penicillium maclennaniae TaxID=1343394 RepID=UPI002541C1B6|nr:uncharacterized protein N7477_002238 [Penicillium maclennaniae]KAJ5676605.1 hypothetical protein N7477_002238 [Penicillium maclennaniae]
MFLENRSGADRGANVPPHCYFERELSSQYQTIIEEKAAQVRQKYFYLENYKKIGWVQPTTWKEDSSTTTDRITNKLMRGANLV